MQPDQSTHWVHTARGLTLLALLTIAGLSQAAFAATKVITDAYKGGKVHLKASDTLELRLKSNPSTGYIWYVEKESTPLMKLIRQSQIESTKQGVGRPVVQVFIFEPRRSGDGKLLLHYVRSWDPPAPDEQQFEILVVIQ
jgi:predicted secreted protein